MPNPPRTLGKYHVLESLAATPLAEVYKVKTVGIAGFEKVQVLSRVTAAYSSDPSFSRAFVEQAKVAFALNHRNIVQVFEFGKIDGELFLATEYIPGVNLREILLRCREREAEMPVGLACYLMGEVAAGLEYAHRKSDQWGQTLGVVHCDLRPLHVACSFEGSVKVLDFGSARAAYETVSYAERHAGLPHYLAPEQITGEPINALVDIFAFGAVLWELLTGSKLFGGDTVAEVHEAILDGPIPPPRSFNHEVPTALDEVTMRCLEREPGRRFATANDLQLELHRIQRDVGAVIGSRALSTFLDDLLPDFAETRDVRQESHEPPAGRAKEHITQQRANIRRRADALVDAAAELARPHNPPARRISDNTAQRIAERYGEDEDSGILPGDARIAGVLRSSRVDENVPMGPTSQRSISRGLDAVATVDGPSAVDTADIPGGSLDPEEFSREITVQPRPIDSEDLELVDEDLLDPPLDGWPEGDARRHHPTEVSVSLPPRRAAEALPTPRPGRETADLRAPLRDDDRHAIETAERDPRRRAATGEQGLPSATDRVARAGIRNVATGVSPEDQATPAARAAITPRPSMVEPLPDSVSFDVPSGSHTQPPIFEDGSVGGLTPHQVPTAPGIEPEELPAEHDELDELDADGEASAHELSRQSSTGARPSQTTRALGERKRCIVVGVVLDCAEHLREEAERLAADIAYKLDGQVHQKNERGLVGLFGLPVGHEHDIVSAVRFAFDAEEAVRHLGIDTTASGVRGGEVGGASLRCGIRAGTARLSGQPAKEGYQLLGNSVREARALAAHADEGQTIIAGAAARLAAAHYVLREGAPVRRQGKSIRCHRIVAPRTGERDRRPVVADPLIGREMETKAMRTVWREAVMRSEQRGLLIVGDAGVGKTRLVDEFIMRYCGEAAVVTVGGTPHRVETPYALLIDVLRGLTGVWSGGRSRERMLERLGKLLEGSEDADDALDALASLFDPRELPLGEAGSGFAKNRVYRALRQLLERAGEQRPVVLAIDDLHWADSASLETIRALATRPDDARGALLLLASARPDERDEISALGEEEALSMVMLDELDEPARQRLIVNLLGEHATDEVLAGVEQRAGGNPFFIRELCDAIKELGGRVSGISETVHGVIASRVDRLPAQVKAVLQHATVIGPSFREGILTRLLSRNPARSLGELRNRGFLVPDANMAVPYASSAGASDQFERQWSFRHVLVQEVIYQGINGVDRRSLHRRIGQIMARRSARGSSDPPSEIGRHLETGGLSEEAASYYLQAGVEASAAYANNEALDLFNRALRLGAGQADVEYPALAGRERVFGRLGLHDEQAADLRSLRKLTGEAPKRVADLRAREAVHLLRVGQLYRALEAAEQAEAASEQAGDALLRAESLRLRGEAYGRLNDHKRAIETATRALEIFEAEGAKAPQVRARIALGRVHLVQADYDAAFSHYDPALELIKETGDRWQERVLRNNLAVVHYCRGDFSRALDEAHYSLELCRRFGDRAREGDNASVVGIVSLEIGLYAQARGYIEEALEIHRETGSLWSQADTMVYAGLLEAASGQVDKALELLEAAKKKAGRMGAKYIEVNAHNAAALVLADRNDPGDAAKAVDEATAAFEAAGQASLIVGEIPGLSRAARATALLGDVEAARALSRRAVELLEAQKTIESAEEEIYYTHFRILDALDDDAALDYLERAHSGFVGKMALLDDASARQAFSDRVRLNVAIRRDYRARHPTASGE